MTSWYTNLGVALVSCCLAFSSWHCSCGYVTLFQWMRCQEGFPPREANISCPEALFIQVWAALCVLLGPTEKADDCLRWKRCKGLIEKEALSWIFRGAECYIIKHLECKLVSCGINVVLQAQLPVGKPEPKHSCQRPNILFVLYSCNL